MKQGTIAETRDDRLQNKLRGVGSLMVRDQFTKEDRMCVAREIYRVLVLFTAVDRKVVFSSFFTKGELSDLDVKVTLIAPH